LGFFWPTHGNAAETPKLNAWIEIQTDDTVIIRYARTEMGQGSRTSAPMLVADELEADWKKVRIEYATAHENLRTKRAYGDMATVGSRTIRNSQEYLRKAGATAREMLIAAAAAQWGVPASECTAALGKVSHAASKRSLSYGKLAAAAAKLLEGRLGDGDGGMPKAPRHRNEEQAFERRRWFGHLRGAGTRSDQQHEREEGEQAWQGHREPRRVQRAPRNHDESCARSRSISVRSVPYRLCPGISPSSGHAAGGRQSGPAANPPQRRLDTAIRASIPSRWRGLPPGRSPAGGERAGRATVRWPGRDFGVALSPRD
jgi:hypothetical protein